MRQSPKRKRKASHVWNKTDPLVYETVSDEDYAVQQEIRFWSPGLLLYVTLFSKTYNDCAITLEMMDEIKEHASNSRSLYGIQPSAVLAFLDRYKNTLAGARPSVEDPVQEFWIFFLELLVNCIEEACKLDSTDGVFLQTLFLPCFQLGCAILLYLNPSHAYRLARLLHKRLDDILHGDDYYGYNPLLLTSTLLFVYYELLLRTKDMLYSDALLDTSCIQKCTPNVTLEVVEEQDVCEQDMAIAYFEDYRNVTTATNLLLNLHFLDPAL